MQTILTRRRTKTLSLVCLAAIVPAALLLKEPQEAVATRAMVVLGVLFSHLASRFPDLDEPSPEAADIHTTTIGKLRDLLDLVGFIAAGGVALLTFITVADLPHRRLYLAIAALLSVIAFLVSAKIARSTKRENTKAA